MGSLRDEHLPLPQELAGDMSDSTRESVCKYLTSGKLFETYRGFSWCRFRCGVTDQTIGCREYTDGEWVWPEGLDHYVRTHHVVLPSEFVAAVTSSRPPSESSNGAGPSLDF